MTTTSSHYNWIKQVPTALLQLDGIPQAGYPPPFPWQEFIAELSTLLKIDDLKITPSPLQWRPEEDLLSGIADKIYPLNFSISTIPGTVSWILADQDVTRLMSLLLTKGEESLLEVDPEYRDGFYRFITLEACNIFSKVKFDPSLSLHLLENHQLRKEPHLCQDFSITLYGQTISGRLVISQEFLDAWKARYAARTLDASWKGPLGEKVQVTVHLEAGRTSLNLSEWKQMSLGDFLILDHCSLQPEEDKGRVMLTVNGIPFFRGKIKQGNVKILEYPLYYEVDTAMGSKLPENNEHEEHDDEDHEEEFEEDFEEEEEIEEHTENEEEASEEEEEEEEYAEEHEEEAEEEKEEEHETKLPDQPTDVQQAAPEKKLSPDEIPLSIIVEVGRVQISIQKLMELQPGNLLELDVHPENGVDLIVNGMRIGKGELLKIGDTLGVRILDMG